MRIKFMKKDNITIKERFYEDGTLEYRKKFIDNLQYGEWLYYYPNGNIKSIHNYNEGELEGEQRGYYFDGGIEYLKIYLNGKLSFKKKYLDYGIKEGSEKEDMLSGMIDVAYYINGDRCNKDEWLIWKRQVKLENILKNINNEEGIK